MTGLGRMTAKTLIEELKQYPPDAQVHVLVADYAPKAWRKIATVMEERDPDNKQHAVLSVFAGENGFAFYEPSGKLRPPAS